MPDPDPAGAAEPRPMGPATPAPPATEVPATEALATEPPIGPSAQVLRGVVVDGIGAGVRLLLSNWRLGLVEVVPALWITAVVGAAVSDVRRWESGTVVHGERLLAESWSRADTLAVSTLAAVGALVYLCNTVFAFAAADPDGPEVRRATRAVWADPRVVAVAMAWGAFAGLLRIVDLLLPLPTERAIVLAQVVTVVAVELVLFASVPARLAGKAQQGLTRGQRAVMGAVSVALGLVAVLPALALGWLAALALSVDWLRPLGVVLFLGALLLQVASVVMVRAVGLAAKLLTREA